MQALLDHDLANLRSTDADLQGCEIRLALLAIDGTGPFLLAHHAGDQPVYPASVVKLVYLMAAYRWQELGRLRIDAQLDGQLHRMAYASDNRATQRVVALLTGTEQGPELPPAAYRDFVARRLAVKRWLESLGITDLHTVHPTYDGGGDLWGRDLQFLRDPTIPGALPSRRGELANRQSMTAIGTVRLLALLATGVGLTSDSCAQVLRHLRRDPALQPHLGRRIAGGASRHPNVEAFSKSGTWGPIVADAGIVRHSSGRQLVIAVFLEREPAYRGDFIAALTDIWTRRLVRDELQP